MKQSIYRFRQAEVSVMLRAVAAIREANLIEVVENRWASGVRREGFGRDPRPIGAGGETAAFIVGTAIKPHETLSAPYTHLSLGEDLDGFAPEFSGNDRQQARAEGLIDLTSNYRTKPSLVHTMNGMFRDVFSQRHHLLPGDWHASSQDLVAGRDEGDTPGVLEWLMPLSTEEGEQSSDLLVPMDVFSNSKSKDVHLEHELIAGRIAALLAGNPTRVWSATTQAYEQVEETDESVAASEIMILVHSRTHVPDLIQRLQNRGIPVAADRQGSLLDRPIVQPLMATLNLIANPQSRSAVLGLARSPVLGFTDGQIEAMMAATPEQNWWVHMAEHAPNQQVGALVSHIGEMVTKGALYEAIDAILDHSDLLVAYPEDADRQNAEAWYMLVASIGNELGHEAAAIYSRLCELHRLGQRGPPATTVPAGGAVRIMTVHNAKGLEASVVFVAGLFKAGASDSQLNSRENILVTPQVIAGRINPWRSQDRPNDGLWEFTQRLDQAQTQAERRRSFYVALTRARDRLVLVGSYANEASINDDSGHLEVKVKASRSTMGGMLLESLRSLAYEAQDEHAPWLLEGDLGVEELPFYDKRTLSLDPYSLLHNPHLGSSAIQSMRLYHHPDCFETTQVTTPLQDWTTLEQRIEAIDSEPLEAAQPLAVRQSVRMTAHGLDTSSACPRRHWLTEVKGWIPEQLKMFGAHHTGTSSSNFPPATSFGTMMHRLVELGLANPSKGASPHSAPLPEAWMFDGDDGLDDSKIIANVLGEEGYSVSEDSMEQAVAIRTHERMGVLGRLVREGLLGRLAAGETHNGLTVEGLRTELPFYHHHAVDVDGIERSTFSIQGAIPHAMLSQLDLIFDGRADLVLALRNEDAEGFLQVVDLKTKDCRDGFNPTDPSKGTALQQYAGDRLDPYPSTSSERSILDEHRLQLTLYSMALQAAEATKPSEEQRRILPPALLVGASGRMLQLTVEEFEGAQQDLNEHLQWIGHLAAAPQSLEEPDRLSPEAAEPCKTCPFYRGDVRLCAPAGEALGIPLPIEED
jgi:ATP-dependent exoDNAse (exonuclease V) beta subunit